MKKILFALVVMALTTPIFADEIDEKLEHVLYPSVRVLNGNGGGSGTVVYSEDREGDGTFETYVLTNHHVIDNLIRIERKWDNLTKSYRNEENNEQADVELFSYANGGSTITKSVVKANIVAYIANEDIALLHLVHPFQIEHVARILPEDKKLRLFQEIYAVGCPLLVDPMFTKGEVTDLDNTIDKKSYIGGTANIIWGNCMPGDTIVSTVNGPVLLKDVTIGTEVYTINMDTSRLETKKVLNFVHSGQKEVVRITSHGRSFRASLDHPILTLRWESFPPPHNKKVGVPTWVRAGDIKKGDVIVALWSTDQEISSERDLVSASGVEFDEDFCWFYGFMLGDGYVRIRSSNNGSSVHACAFDDEDESRLIKIVESKFGVTPGKTFDGGTINWYSTTLANTLTDMGFSGKAHEKTVPDWVFSLPKHLRISLLRGYADSDGHYQSDTDIRVEAVSKDLVEGLYYLAMTSGMRVSNIYSRHRSPPEKIGSKYVNTSRRSYRFSFNLKEENRPTLVRCHSTNTPDIGPNFFAASVKKVESVGVEDVYDIEVEDTHNFIADGVVVHNSGGAVMARFDEEWYFCGIPSRGYGAPNGQFVTYMGYYISPLRIIQFAKTQKLNFLLDANVTPAQSFEAREAARRRSDDGESSPDAGDRGRYSL